MSQRSRSGGGATKASLPGICELPLETFISALDRLAQTCARVVVIGSSYGAVASLLVGVHDRRVDAVIAFAPSHVVWANVGAGHDGQLRPCRSMFTLAGEPLPFVPHDDSWEPVSDPPAYRGGYLQSLRPYADDVEAAVIPVEKIRGDVVLVAGGDDQVWPGLDFAQAIVTRRGQHGLTTSLVTHPAAGHRTVLPGEAPVQGGQQMLRGGSPEADVELGARAWPEILQALAPGLKGGRRDLLAPGMS